MVTGMVEYIEKEAATTIPPIPKEFRDYQTYNLDDAFDDGWYEAQRCIANLPAANVRENVKAKWTTSDLDDNCVTCSNCKKLRLADRHAFTQIAFDEWGLHFCPNCGAQMGGAEDEMH